MSSIETATPFDFYTHLLNVLIFFEQEERKRVFKYFSLMGKEPSLDYSELSLLFSLRQHRGYVGDQPVMKTLILSMLICFKDELNNPAVCELIKNFLKLVETLKGKTGFKIGEMSVHLTETSIEIDSAELEHEKARLIRERSSRMYFMYLRVHLAEAWKTW